MVRLGIAATVAAIIIAATAIVLLDEEILDENPWLLSGFFVILAIPVIYSTRFFLAATQRSNAARVGADQFPEIWAIYTELLDIFCLPNPPVLYIQNGNGAVNAFALSCSPARNYVILNSEIAMLADEYPQIVRFVLAHELAHHKLGHVKLGRLVLSVIMDMMYLPGKALSRAQEYSADRLALAMCPDTADALMLLAVGPWLAGRVSSKALEKQASDEDNSLMIRIVNASQTHPVFTKRFRAMKQIEQEGFGHHGALF